MMSTRPASISPQPTTLHNRPTRTGSVVKHIGESFHLNRLWDQRLYLAEINADHWKTWVHQRLSTPVGQPGAMTLFHAQPTEHLSFANNACAAGHLSVDFSNMSCPPYAVRVLITLASRRRSLEVAGRGGCRCRDG